MIVERKSSDQHCHFCGYAFLSPTDSSSASGVKSNFEYVVQLCLGGLVFFNCPVTTGRSKQSGFYGKSMSNEKHLALKGADNFRR